MPNPNESICRTCMINKTNEEEDFINSNKDEMISIFNIADNAKENFTFLEILKSAVPQLRIEKDDPLPKFVCLECSLKIKEFFNFQKKCLETEEKFYNMLREDQVVDQFKVTENGVYFVKAEVGDSIKEVEATFEVKDYFSEDNISNKSSDSVWSISNDSIWNGMENERKTKPQKKQFSVDKKANKKNSIVARKSSRNRTNKTLANEMYPCDKCQRKLKSKLSLIKHQEMHNKKDKEEQELMCNLCNMRFGDSSLLKNHQRTHNECGKGFTSAGGLKQHSLRHLDKRMYACSECPKSFHTKTDLLCHNDTHKAKPKIHVCDICGRGFYKPFLLKQHKRYHNNERPYACEFCDKCFVTSEKQRRHMRIHTGEKPYRCKYCERAFTQSNDCIKHLKQHLGDNVYQCDLCPLRFPLARDLRTHFATHKSDDEETRARNLEARAAEEKNLRLKFGESSSYLSI